MAEQFYTILTAVGKAKIANAAALGRKVELTELALGDGGGSYYNPTEDQTELRNEVWRGAIGTVDVDTENPNWITIQTVVPGQHGGFMIREAGVFDNEGDLIAVGKYPETYKPTAADGSIKDLVIRMILEVSNTASVVLRVDPTVILATQQQVDAAEARAKAYTDQEVAEVSQALDAHKAAAAPHSGHETPAGAQAKAEAAEANAKSYTDTHASTKNTHGVGSGYYIAKTSRSDQLPAWNEVQGKPSNFPPSAHKSTHASGGSDALTPSDIGAETPAGAQAKAEAAAGAVQAELDAHVADNVRHITSAERATWNGKQNALGYTPVNKSGDEMTGILTAHSNTSYTVRQVRNIILSNADANLGAMQNGDIWIKYK